jgi:hypothetical protein
MKIDVVTNRYSSSRAGANTAETLLNQTNVNVNAFGKIFSRGVDGQIYAQPLIVSDLQFADGTKRSLVVVATTRNMVYAFDAEDPSQCHPVWRVELDRGGETPVPRSDYSSSYIDFTAEIGVTSTPAIDRSSGIVYLTSKSKHLVGGKQHYTYYLHALDLRTGAERPNGPGVIAETVVNDPQNLDKARNFTFISGPSAKGSGDGSVNGTLTFNAFFQLQRPGLLLQDGLIYLGFASQGDRTPYHGWVLAYDAVTLKLVNAYCTTPDWGDGGIWQSGCGLAGDGLGNIFAVCGNGRAGNLSDAQLSAGPFFGQSVVKLTADRNKAQFQLDDWYTPRDVVTRNAADDDMCAGPVLLPWNNLVGAWGKDRAYHIMDRAKLGKFNANQNAIVQFAPNMTTPENGGGTGHIHCAPAFFDDPTIGPVSYVWGENDMLRGYRFDTQTSQFETQVQPTLRSQQVLPIGMPGGMLTVSSNGSGANAARGTAIVWACHPTDGNANTGTVAGVLEAFRADDLRQPIWSSNHDPRGTDDLGEFAKFCPPVVANGRVYVATFSKQLVVYGLLSEGLGDPLGKWLQEDIPVQGNANTTFQVEGTATFSCNRFTILGSGHDIWDPADAFHFVYQPVQNGPVTISARVISVQETSDWAKAGVMIRETLDADSAHAMMVITPGHGAAFQFRSSKGAQSVNVSFSTPVTAPFWVRLARTSSGNSFHFAGSVSRDGANWTEVGSTNFAMGPTALAGMPVTAHMDGDNNSLLQDLCVAIIDKVELTT